MKKLFIALNLFALLLVPMATRAQFTFTTNGGDITITSYNDLAGRNVVIPDSVNGYPVTAIGDEAFLQSDITNVTIGTNVTSIGNYAFAECFFLASGVTIPNSVTSIGTEAFYSYDSTNMFFLGNAPILGFYVFLSANPTTVIYYVPGTTGWGMTYGGLNTAAITLPAIVTSPASQTVLVGGNVTFNVTASGTPSLSYQWYFGSSAISAATDTSYSLNNLTLGNAGNYYAVVTNNFGSATSSVATLTVPLTPFTTTTNNGAITITGYYTNGGLNVLIPTNINGYPVTAIGASAFYQLPITSVTIPNGITNIGTGAFQDCSNLTSIAISSNVTSIGSQAFDSCSSLTNIAVDAANPNYTSVGGVLFNKSLTSLIEYPAGLAGSYVVPGGVTSISSDAFNYCLGLTNVTIPASVINLNTFAFLNCSNLHQAYFQGNAPRASSAFSGETGTLYYVSGATGWGGTFDGWTTVAITLPAISASPTNLTVAAGGNAAFNVTASGTPTPGYQWYFASNAINSATAASYSLNNVTASNVGSYFVVVTNPFGSATSSVATLALSGPSFNTSTNNGTVTITGISGASGAITIPDTINGLPVTGIGVQAFNNNTTITSLVISTNVLNIADAAFDNCTALTNVFIPNSVTNLGNSAFAGCTSLTTVTGGSNVMSMGQSVFNGCGVLSAFNLSTNLASVGSFAFFNCLALTNIVIPATLTQLSDYMFDDCPGLTNVTLPNTLTGIGNSTFAFCSGLMSITIPSSVTNLAASAFQSCGALTSVFFPGNAPAMTSDAFGGDGNATIYRAAQATGWGVFAAETSAPVVAYNPHGAAFTRTNSQFGFTVTGVSNTPVVVEAATSLGGPWTALQTFALTNGAVNFIDAQAGSYPGRYYRFRSP